MYKQKRVWSYLMFLICSVSLSSAQISVSPGTVGCVPFVVTFNGPAGATNVLWNFGSGMGTSTLTSPNPVYTSPGTYNVSYSALLGGNQVNYTAQIQVYPAPSGNVSAVIPSTHCAPMTVAFTGAGACSGCIYTWAFGDLSPLVTGASVSHVYATANSFVPVVTVLDPVTTCTAVAVSNITVNVSNPPVPFINSSNGYLGCVPPFTTNINGSSSSSGSPLGNALTYNWSFQGGSPSSSGVANPGQVSFGAGSNVISLQLTDNNQCSSTTTVGLLVTGAVSLTAVIPPTVCVNSPVPATITTNQNGIAFSYAPAVPFVNFPVTPIQSNHIDTLCFLPQGGVYIFTVTAQSPGCPSASQTLSVFSESVTVNLSLLSPSFVCQPTLVNSYVNLSTVNSSSSLTFTWNAANMGNPAFSVTPASTIVTGLGSPTFTFSVYSPNPYTIYSPYVPVITLNAQSNSIAHCKASLVIDTYTISRPTAWFNRDKREGCVPLTINFADFSYTEPIFPITSYTWCNGAPTPSYVTGTVNPPAVVPNQSFTYSNTGSYYPYLIIETANGCRDTSFHDSVSVVNPPTVNATFPSTACAGQSVTINMNGTITPGVPTSTVMQQWHIVTDNGFFSGCVNNSSPSFPFTHVGTHTIIAEAYQASCKGTTTMAPTIDIRGPIGKFRYETTCAVATRSIVTFTVNLQEASSAVLNYGDGNSDAIAGNVTGITNAVFSHTYNSTGNFVVNLVSSNNLSGCASYTFTQTVKIRNLKANIRFNGQPIPALPAAMACVRQKYKFDGAASVDHEGCGVGFTWFLQTPTHTLAPVIRPMSLSSFSTLISTVTPNPPAPPFPPDTIRGMADPVARDTFWIPGTYTISLVVKDANSCIDIDTKVFRISSAQPAFSFTSNPVCLSNGAVQFINSSSAGQVAPDQITNYKWDFGDLTAPITTTNPGFSPVHTFPYANPPAQVFTVVCTATNNVGCSASTAHTFQVNNPQPNLTASNLFPCIPASLAVPVNFGASTGNATYSVSYGDSSPPIWYTSSSFANANHPYNTPGTYVPTLTIIDPAGCKASQSLTITAYGQPTASIFFPNGIIAGCSPWIPSPKITSGSSVNITPIQNFVWASGNITSPPPAIDPNFSWTFINPLTTFSLTVSVGNNFNCPSTATAQVRTYSPVVTAIISPTTICLGQNLTASITPVHDIYGWKWLFGDFVNQPLEYYTAFTPTIISYPYTIYPTGSNNGEVTVTLIMYSSQELDKGCSPSFEFPIRIIKVNSDFKQSQDIYQHCLRLPDTFTSTSINLPDLNLSYNWNFGDQGTGTGPTPSYSHTYTQPGNYSVTLTVRDVDYGCVANSVKNMIIFPLPSATLGAVPLVCPSASFVITGTATPGVSGPVTGTLSPAINTASLDFGSSNTFTAVGSLNETTALVVTVKDTNNCVNSSSSLNVFVQEPAPQVNWDTTVVIGQQIPLNAFAGQGFSYTWTPLITDLNCTTCIVPNPNSSSTINITYTVLVEDTLKCSIVKSTYHITIDPRVTLDVPSAFTPNGDGINDIIYADGWGLRKLLYFRIFNRWGQLIFESNDLKTGWNGMFNGIPQNMETYVYQVSAETFLPSQPTLFKTGTFKLIR